jgi:threonine synthase
MQILSTRDKKIVSIANAIKTGIAPDGGLYIPDHFPHFNNYSELAQSSLQEFAVELLTPFFDSVLTVDQIHRLCDQSFNFPLAFKPLPSRKNCYLMELFHGPTAAFKDFGAQFLANFLDIDDVKKDEKKLILVATSGDTGGAVASAFHGKSDFKVAIFYPKGKVSTRQKYQLTCWDGNVRAFELDGTFDDCQSIVKQLLLDYRHDFNLGSANSINLGRLLPQMIYHAYTAIHLNQLTSEFIDFIIPTGNLGNALACVWAREMGMPIRTITLATNANKTLVDFFKTGIYEPRDSISTLANAMDVGNPSNFERLQTMYPDMPNNDLSLFSVSVSDDLIKQEIISTYEADHEIVCPHTATALYAYGLIASGAKSVVAATAHPCKFDEVVSPLIGCSVELNQAMKELESRPTNFNSISCDVSLIAKELSNWYR